MTHFGRKEKNDLYGVNIDKCGFMPFEKLSSISIKMVKIPDTTSYMPNYLVTLKNGKTVFINKGMPLIYKTPHEIFTNYVLSGIPMKQYEDEAAFWITTKPSNSRKLLDTAKEMTISFN